MQRQPGDFVKVFSNPLKKKYLIGTVKLLNLISDHRKLELWEVQFMEPPYKKEQILIKKFKT